MAAHCAGKGDTSRLSQGSVSYVMVSCSVGRPKSSLSSKRCNWESGFEKCTILDGLGYPWVLSCRNSPPKIAIK